MEEDGLSNITSITWHPVITSQLDDSLLLNALVRSGYFRNTGCLSKQDISFRSVLESVLDIIFEHVGK